VACFGWPITRITDGDPLYYNLGVSTLRLPSAIRIGLWQAYSRKCVYCGDPIALGDLDIDHVVPEMLNDKKEELERAKTELGLPPGFDVNSLGNLVPAHRRCNLAKSGRMFHPARARYFLEIAAGKEAVVRRCIDAMALQHRKDRLLAGVRAAFESGDITMGDVSDLVPGCGSFPLSIEVDFFDGPMERRIRQDEIDKLLDKQVLLGGTASIDGVEFINGTGQPLVVRTCREYRAARAAGYYAPTTFAIKMEAFLSATDAILDAVAHAQIASVSYVSNPFIGVADLHLLSKDVLPRIGPGDDEAIVAIAEPSLRELSRARKLSVVDVSSTRLQFEWEYSGAVLAELLRADLDGDGAEEILIQYYTYAVGGTLGYGSIGLLRRPEPDSMFEYVANWR
jgi:hypothetical protein